MYWDEAVQARACTRQNQTERGTRLAHAFIDHSRRSSEVIR
jgi:hypothetical protein